MMRLSEAIRLGAISCKWGQHEIQGPDGSRCALGMAAYSAGHPQVIMTCTVIGLWPWIKERIAENSECSVAVYIIHWNDQKVKTPLEIADWVEGLERERGMWDEEVIQADVKQEVKTCHHSLPASV